MRDAYVAIRVQPPNRNLARALLQPKRQLIAGWNHTEPVMSVLNTEKMKEKNSIEEFMFKVSQCYTAVFLGEM